MSTTEPSRRVALVADAGFYVGPPIARLLAARGHDLVIGNPAAGLVEELRAAGATVEVVDGVRNLADPAAAAALVHAALQRFGRIDAAVAFSGRIVTGSFLDSSLDDLRTAVAGCLEAPFHFLRAVVPVMVGQGHGQVLVFTSAAGATHPECAAVLGGPGGRHDVGEERRRRSRPPRRAGECDRHQLHGLPRVPGAAGADDPAVRARIEAAVPMRRLGTVDECAAFCMPYIDGTSGFTTGQFVAYAGGWA